MPADVHQELRREQTLLHGRQQVSAAGADLDLTLMPMQHAHGFFHGARTQHLNCRQGTLIFVYLSLIFFYRLIRVQKVCFCSDPRSSALICG